MRVRRTIATSLAVAMAAVLAASPALAAAKAAPTEKVNLNTATIEAADDAARRRVRRSPARIVEYREKAGPVRLASRSS